MSSHKPRKKRNVDDLAPTSTSPRHTVITDTASGHKKPAFPLVAFLWPLRSLTRPWIPLSLVLIVAFLFRVATSLWTYSGYNAPPLHGDFEAQRHWMEITTQLPVSQWYFHELEWWGLDYPPLTAYHSWACGKVGGLIDGSWFALRTSRGLEEQNLKVFMRSTVLASEYAIYVPAAVIAVRRFARLSLTSPLDSSVALTALLMQPATMLIDHGHFQYNTVMLGFLLATVASLMTGSFAWACVFFVASLGFKQMALFYAPAVFCYLLGSCLTPRINLARLIRIALATAVSFAALYAPLLLASLYESRRGIAPGAGDAPPPPLLAFLPPALHDPDAWFHTPLLQLTQSIHRIFPFARGLFEDKVANLWCAVHSSGLYKLHHLPVPAVQRLALLATLAGIAPPCLVLLLRPRRALLPGALAASAWAFFLCSYQVHEKNVLLPLLPTTLLLAGPDGLAKRSRAWVAWANALACWSMFPLLRRDGLAVPYAVLAALWAYLMGLPPASLRVYMGPGVDWATAIVHLGGYAAMLAWHAAERFVPPPEGKPDLWLVANAVIGAGGFGFCYLWCVWGLLVKSELFALSRASAAKKTQ